MGEYVSGDIKYNEEEIADVKWMTVDEIKSIDKKNIRGGETIDEILALAEKRPISLDRIKIANFL